MPVHLKCRHVGNKFSKQKMVFPAVVFYGNILASHRCTTNLHGSILAKKHNGGTVAIGTNYICCNLTIS